jgi:DNA-binding XRE family transcriptional regulator
MPGAALHSVRMTLCQWYETKGRFETGAHFVITGTQIRAARVLLGWSQLDLCQRSGVSRATLVAIERGTGNPIFVTVGSWSARSKMPASN